jgi:hypothetical protein
MNCLRETFRAKVKLVCPEFNVSNVENNVNNNSSSN